MRRFIPLWCVLLGAIISMPLSASAFYVEFGEIPGATPAATATTIPGAVLLPTSTIGIPLPSVTTSVAPSPTPRLSVSPRPVQSPTLSPGATQLPPHATTEVPVGGDTPSDQESANSAPGWPVIAAYIIEGVTAISGLIVLLGAVSMARSGADIGGQIAFGLQALWQVLGLKRKTRVWGTVYDSVTKRGISFAKVELLDEAHRVLETRFADRDGRYGFLAQASSLQHDPVHVQIHPSVRGYTFPSTRISPVGTDFVVYDHIYTAGDITLEPNDFIHHNIPLDPIGVSAWHSEYLSLAVLSSFVAQLLNGLFWVGLISGPIAVYYYPTAMNILTFAIFIAINAIRYGSGLFRPFGIVYDATTGRPLSYALVTLNDRSGARVAYCVSDESGRYFLHSGAGAYTLWVATSANTTPQRSATLSLVTASGWISRKLTV